MTFETIYSKKYFGATRSKVMADMKGCIHIRIRNRKIDKIFCHSENLQQDGILHISLNDLTIEFMNKEQFLQTHPRDKKELEINTPMMFYNLGDKTIDQL